MNISLDGFMAGPNCELDWHFQNWNNEMAEATAIQLSEADTILFGRITYNGMAKYWSSKITGIYTPREDIDFADMLNTYRKIVFSKTLTKATWNNSTIVRDMPGEIKRLKQLAGRDMMIYGSGKLVASMVELGLIDEYRVWVHPVAIGKGKPLFRDLNHTLPLELYDTERFSSGVVLLYYKYVRRSVNELIIDNK